MSDVIVLTETWLSGTIASYTLLPSGQFNGQRVDRKSPVNCHISADGVLVALKMPYQMTVFKKYTSQYIQIMTVHISAIQQKGLYILAVYNSPDRHNSPESLLQQSKARLATIPHNEPCMIIGDINENALATTHGPIQTAIKSLHVLDHIYTRNIDCMDTCVSATYYSDHHWASCNLKF
ncbi:hypothetical protein DPMN_127217 [Dreissena polymorpha]|uniref:Endonuclease/exonuclease/phosphatase domain-containing protein n=1 Tax=Dreissena polymorpha TaxID=45954 RepID=A0A9D4GYT4_DREPO|nr:hypothetical protein DPMN_127217 [Dreissena polymorpha]